MEEIWKDINGYEGIYQVSNLGRIKALEKIIYFGKYKGKRIVKEHILTQTKNNELGYLKVDLHHNGKRKCFKVHRLVAIAFIPNPENKPEVNHKFGNVKDNRVSELEWNTASENRQHSFTVLNRKNPKGFDNSASKSVVQVSLDGFILNVFGSRNEAMRITGVPPTNINHCVAGRWKKAGGFIWI